jgi:hypothetical protein
MSFSPEHIIHYAMLLRLVMLMAISGFGILVVILVPIMRLWLAHLTVAQSLQAASPRVASPRVASPQAASPRAAGWSSGRQAHEGIGVAMRDLGSV